MLLTRAKEYSKEHCWQYDIRLRNREEDLSESGFTEKYVSSLRVNDFDFKEVFDVAEKKSLVEFIVRHEWLGTLSQYTTNWFACYHKGVLSGVILFNMPNAFSKYLGEETKTLERLISRGACISWSPKNLASCFLMWAIKQMVEKTPYRLFTAYSDPAANELGTIYQACGFYYLGQTFGAKTRYINPYTGKVVSDRYFRQKTAYKKYASELGISWQASWNHATGMSWGNMPSEMEKVLKDFGKKKQAESDKIMVPLKHKYALVLGVDKRETKKLRAELLSRTKVFPYPKQRGEF